MSPVADQLSATLHSGVMSEYVDTENQDHRTRGQPYNGNNPDESDLILENYGNISVADGCFYALPTHRPYRAIFSLRLPSRMR